MFKCPELKWNLTIFIPEMTCRGKTGDAPTMNYHFISDDSFFLLGVQKLINSHGGSFFFHNLSNKEQTLFIPHPGDVVVIAINNVHLRSRLLRSRLLRRRSLARSRLIIMLDIPLTPVHLEHFPWLLPKNISTEAFSAVIQKAERSSVFRAEVPRETLPLFENLCSGKSVTNLSESDNKPLKYIYRVKRNVFIKYGLLKSNSAGILLCRDMLSIKTPV